MPKVSTQVEVLPSDRFWVRRRPDGGFHLMIGQPGGERAMLTFSDIAQASELNIVLGNAPFVHGAPAMAKPDETVVSFPTASRAADTPPLDAA